MTSGRLERFVRFATPMLQETRMPFASVDAATAGGWAAASTPFARCGGRLLRVRVTRGAALLVLQITRPRPVEKYT